MIFAIPSASFGCIYLMLCKIKLFHFGAGPRSAVGSTSDSRARGPEFDIRSGHILSFLHPLIQEGQLSVTGESTCTKYWLTINHLGGLSLPRKSVARSTDHPDMTSAVYLGHKTTTQQLFHFGDNYSNYFRYIKF